MYIHSFLHNLKLYTHTVNPFYLVGYLNAANLAICHKLPTLIAANIDNFLYAITYSKKQLRFAKLHSLTNNAKSDSRKLNWLH